MVDSTADIWQKATALATKKHLYPELYAIQKIIRFFFCNNLIKLTDISIFSIYGNSSNTFVTLNEESFIFLTALAQIVKTQKIQCLCKGNGDYQNKNMRVHVECPLQRGLSSTRGKSLQNMAYILFAHGVL